MKTTNYEISKKLKEAGFEAETDFYWYCYDKGQEMRHIADADGRGNVKAYDLETLLDALPKKITTKFKHFDTGEIYEFEETLKIYKSGISYSHNEDDIDWYRTHYGYYSTFDLSVNNSEGLKSLADTAGKLLIQLFEEGIINFNK